MEVNNFYHWWTNKIQGNYIPNHRFESVLERFDDNTNNEYKKAV